MGYRAFVGIALALVIGCGPGGTRTTLDCADVSSLGGTQASRTQVQAVYDYAGAAQGMADELETACAQMAGELGTETSELAAALQSTYQPDRIERACALAHDALVSARGRTDIALHITGPACDDAAKDACEASCVPASAICSGACAAAASAKVACTISPLTVSGASSAALAKTLSDHAPRILALAIRFQGMADHATDAETSARATNDITAACIPRLVSSARFATLLVAAGASATANLKDQFRAT